METVNPNHWRLCNGCKKPIQYKQNYWVCSVSTCTRKRTGFVFCTVSCWDSHVPMMNHRESWAEERKAPSMDEWKQILIDEAAPKTRAKKVVEVPKTPEPEKPKGPPKVIIRRSTG